MQIFTLSWLHFRALRGNFVEIRRATTTEQGMILRKSGKKEHVFCLLFELGHFSLHFHKRENKG